MILWGDRHCYWPDADASRPRLSQWRLASIALENHVIVILKSCYCYIIVLEVIPHHVNKGSTTSFEYSFWSAHLTLNDKHRL